MKLITRRALLCMGLASVPAALTGCLGGPGRSGTFTVTASGQALMTHDLCASRYPGFDRVINELQRGDICFTGLEAPVRTPRSGEPTRSGIYLHVAPLSVLSCLDSMGFDFLALSNNHAYDLGSRGITANREAVLQAGFSAAGTGKDLTQASEPGYHDGKHRVGLVAMAIGKIRDGGAATVDRPGVNEVRWDGDRPMERDVERVLDSIGIASRHSECVIVYLSNHQWGDDNARTKPWARDLARRCIDAGGDIYVTHGAPLLHGLEVYRGRPIFHGLGSLVFHSRTPVGHYPAETWESAIAHVSFTGNRLQGIEVVPVALNEVGDDPQNANATRGRPRLAHGKQARRILERFASLTAAMGSEVLIREERGYLVR